MRASTESCVDDRTVELDRLVRRPVRTDLAGEVQDEVLAEDAGLQLALVGDLERIGHLEPQLARGHGGSAVGRAHAGREDVDRSVGARVRVAAHHQVAGDDVALLGDELVAHALTHVVDGRAGLLAELAHHRVKRRDALDGTRRAVVHHHGDLRRVEDLVDTHALERLDRERRGPVLAHHEVDVRDHDVAGVSISSRVCREDLLGDGLAWQCYQPPCAKGSAAAPNGILDADRLPLPAGARGHIGPNELRPEEHAPAPCCRLRERILYDRPLGRVRVPARSSPTRTKTRVSSAPYRAIIEE